jgi:hypothetical protein
MWAFFPELPIAAFLVLSAPIWGIILVANGHPLAALLLVVTVLPLGYAAYRAIRANEGWVTYGAIIGILVIGCIVGSYT